MRATRAVSSPAAVGAVPSAAVCADEAELGLGRVDYAFMVFVHISILLDFVLFPKQKGKKTEEDVV